MLRCCNIGITVVQLFVTYKVHPPDVENIFFNTCRFLYWPFASLINKQKHPMPKRRWLSLTQDALGKPIPWSDAHHGYKGMDCWHNLRLTPCSVFYLFTNHADAYMPISELVIDYLQ